MIREREKGIGERENKEERNMERWRASGRERERNGRKR